MLTSGLSLIGCILLGSVAPSIGNGPEVETTLGRIQGTVTNGANVYRGVPYAMPPVGLLRWQPPQALPSWKHEGVKDTVEDPPACPQVYCDKTNPSIVCPTKVNTDIDCMRSKDEKNVAEAAFKSRSKVSSLKILEMFEPYGPYVDGKLVKGQPLDVISRGNYTSKLLIIGTTTEETVLYVYSAFNKTVHLEEYLALVAGLKPESAAKIVEQYPPSLYPQDQREVIVNVSTDLIFACATRNLSRTLLAQGQRNIWLYVWDHALSFKGWGPITWCEGRVCHGSEIAFVFDSAHLANFTTTPEEEILSGDVIAYWTNFAWSGNPNYSTPPKHRAVPLRFRPQNTMSRLDYEDKWPAYGVTSSWTALRFKTPISQLVTNYKGNNCNFWDSVSYS